MTNLMLHHYHTNHSAYEAASVSVYLFCVHFFTKDSWPIPIADSSTTMVHYHTNNYKNYYKFYNMIIYKNKVTKSIISIIP